MVNQRREDRRSFFGPYGDAANWQPPQTVTDPPLDPARTGRPMDFTGEKRVAANSLSDQMGQQSLQLPDRPQPNPRKFTPSGRPVPYLGKKRPKGWEMPQHHKAMPPQLAAQFPSDPNQLSKENPVAKAVADMAAKASPEERLRMINERIGRDLKSFGGGGAPRGNPADAAMRVGPPDMPGETGMPGEVEMPGSIDRIVGGPPPEQVTPENDVTQPPMAGGQAPQGPAGAQSPAAEANRIERERLAQQYPEGRQVFSNMPGQAPGTATAATPPNQGRGLMDTNIGPQRNFAPPAQQQTRGSIDPQLTPRDEQIRSNLGDIDRRLAAGEQISPEQMAKVQEMRRQAGYLRGGTDRVPVGPDGLPLRQPQQSVQQRLAGMDQNQNIRTTSDGYTYEGPAGQGSRFFEPTGKGDPVAEKARRQQHEQFLNRQGFQKSASIPQTEEGFGDREHEIALQNFQEGRAFDNESRRFTLDQQKAVAALQKRGAASTDPVERQQIAEALRFYGLGGEKEKGGEGAKTELFTTKDYDNLGNVTGESQWFHEGGQNVRQAIPQELAQDDIPTKDKIADGFKKNINGVPHVWSKKQGGFVPAGR